MSTQDFAALYTSGDLILQNPIESSSIFLMVVVVCASIEYLFSLAERVDSKFFRLMFATVSEEVLVFGVLSLMLTFGSSLHRLPVQWAVMFDWAHICLLFMTIMFVTLLCTLCMMVFSSNQRWSKFEKDRIGNPKVNDPSREVSFRLAYDKFKTALRAHGLPTTVNFSAYILKAEKNNLIALGNLSWKSWLALSTIVVLNAQRTRAIPQTPSATDPDELLSETDSLINIVSFVGVAGYGTLGLFGILHGRQQLRFRQYLMLTNNTVNGAAGTLLQTTNSPDREQGDREELSEALAPNKADLDDPRSFLLWQSHENCMAMVQCVFMFFAWYLAVFCLNMLYKSATQFNIGITLLIICGTLAPVVIFVVLAPWTLTTIALLSSLGTSLQTDWVKDLVAAEQQREDIDERGGEEMTDRNRSLNQGAANSRSTGKIERRSLRPVLLDEASMHRLASAYRTQNASNVEL